MCTRTNSMYLYITWAIWCTWRGREARVYPGGRTGPDDDRRFSRLSLSRQARTRVPRGRSRGRIAFQISRYDYELHDDNVDVHDESTSEVLVSTGVKKVTPQTAGGRDGPESRRDHGDADQTSPVE